VPASNGQNIGNRRLFGVMSGQPLLLVSTGGDCSKKILGNSKKNKKNGIPLFFSVKEVRSETKSRKRGKIPCFCQFWT